MKFMLMLHCPRNGYESFGAWPKEDFRAHIRFMGELNKQLKEEGHFVLAEGLGDPRDAKIVRSGQKGKMVTDGPFAETKEFLAGYWIVEVDTPEQAYEIAARASAAPGLGGKPLGMPIEVRQVMSGPPKEFL